MQSSLDLNCPKCTEKFDYQEHQPRILSCYDQICLKCAKSSPYQIGNYSIECTLCSNTTLIPCLDQLPSNPMTLYFIGHKDLIESNKQDKSDGSDSSDDSESIDPNLSGLKDKLANLEYEFEVAKAEMLKHYDDTEIDIDIRAENLINFVHDSRDILHAQVRQYRNLSLLEFEKINEDPTYKKLKMNIENDKNKIECARGELDLGIVNSVIINCSKLKGFLSNIKKNYWKFIENSAPINESILGCNINVNTDLNFLKIRHLRSILNDPTKHLKVNLITPNNFERNSIKKEVIPLSSNRIIKTYFTTKRELKFELFDESGKMIKLLEAFDNLASIPLFYGYGDFFLVLFSAKHPDYRHSFGLTPYFIYLYDKELNVISSLIKYSSVESVYMNEKYIVCVNSYKIDKCCVVYDYRFNEVYAFGQQDNENEEFYMEKSQISEREMYTSNVKLNPKIFGFTNECIYMYNMNNMIILDRRLGVVLKKLKIVEDKPIFMLDNQNNIIQVNNQSKRITFNSNDFNLSLSSNYNDELDTVFLNKQNQMVFIDKFKEFVVFM